MLDSFVGYSSFVWLSMIEFNQISIITWNIRGAASRKGKRHVRELVHKHHPTFFLIYETHVQFGEVTNLWSNLGYSVVDIVEANGHSGDIWFLTNDNRFSITILDSFHQVNSVGIRCDDKEWVCTAVYASPIPSIRSNLWSHLNNLRSLVTCPWLLVGDFNEILLPSEVKGGNFLLSRANQFAQVLDECKLLDLGASGSKFTWCKNNQGKVLKRLDSAIVDCNWRTSFWEAMAENLCRMHSDHNPVIVRCGSLPSNSRDRPFRFEAAWATHPVYYDVVVEAWKEGATNVVAGLDKVREDSILFNKMIFGNIF